MAWWIASYSMVIFALEGQNVLKPKEANNLTKIPGNLLISNLPDPDLKYMCSSTVYPDRGIISNYLIKWTLLVSSRYWNLFPHYKWYHITQHFNHIVKMVTKPQSSSSNISTLTLSIMEHRCTKYLMLKNHKASSSSARASGYLKFASIIHHFLLPR